MKVGLAAFASILLGLSGCSTPADEPPSPGSAATRPPNIIFIVADDLGYGDVDAFEAGRPQTPHIDRLVAEGVKVTSGYVTAPVCSPSRAGLMSGRYQQRFGFEFNGAAGPRGGGFPATVPTLAERLKAAGYRTRHIGKWHLGWGEGQRPYRRGFDESFGMSSGNPYFPPGFPGVQRAGRWQEDEEGGGTIRVFRNGEPAPIEKNITDAFTDEAVAFIQRNRSEPFFLYLAYNTPHTPLQAEEARLARFPKEEMTSDQRILAAMVASLDDGIGRITEQLRSDGLERDTLIVLVSDNGCPLYLQGACSNARLSGGKRHLLEGGIRVPFVVRHTGAIRPGVYERPVNTLDLTATAVAAARADAQGLDGADLRPYLNGRRGDPHEALFWRMSPARAVRSGDWKLMKMRRPDGEEATFLFDIARDPQERINLASAHPDVVRRLELSLAGWEAQMRPPSSTPRTEVHPVAGVPVTHAF